MRLQEIREVAAVYDERVEVFFDDGGRRTRPFVEERDLAEEMTRRRRLEDDLFTGVVLEEDFDGARPDDVHRVPGVAAQEHRLTRGGLDSFQPLGKRHPL